MADAINIRLGELATRVLEPAFQLFNRMTHSPAIASPSSPKTPAVRKRTPKLAAGSPLIPIFEHEYRELRPRAPIPPLDIRFRRFTSLNTTIRLREGHLHVRLSDILEHAPDSVHHAIAHILLAKLYKSPSPPPTPTATAATSAPTPSPVKPNTYARPAVASASQPLLAITTTWTKSSNPSTRSSFTDY